MQIKKSAMMLLALLLTVNVMASEYSILYMDTPLELQEAETPNIPETTVTVTDYGAVGDGITLCTDKIQAAIDDLAAKGGGHVVVPAGIYLVTSIEMKSNIDLHIEQNAVLMQSPVKSLYKHTPGMTRVYSCIYGEGLHDVSITGNGTIDGNGKYWRPVKRGKMSDVEWKRFTDMGGTLEEDGKLWMPYDLNNVSNVMQNSKKEESLRADLFRLVKCERVLLQGVTFQNSPRFHVHPFECTDLVIDGITVRSPWNAQNSDGIDLTSCKKVLLINSTVDVGDDGICMKAGVGEEGLRAGACQDVLIQDCRVYHAHGGFVIGSDVSGGMNNIVVRRCYFSGTDTGLRFKSAVGRGGKTTKIRIEDIMMTDIVNEAITFNCEYADKRYSSATSDKDATATATDDMPFAPDFQDIVIDRVTCREAKTAIKAAGVAGIKAVHDITVRNSTFFYSKQSTDISETAELKLENNVMKTWGE